MVEFNFISFKIVMDVIVVKGMWYDMMGFVVFYYVYRWLLSFFFCFLENFELFVFRENLFLKDKKKNKMLFVYKREVGYIGVLGFGFLGDVNEDVFFYF